MPEPGHSVPIARQALWSALSSGAAFFAVLLPTAGLALQADRTVVAVVVLGIWQATLVSALASLGIPTLIAPLVARSGLTDLSRIGAAYGGFVVVHMTTAGLAAIGLSALGLVDTDGRISATIGIAALTVAISAQATGNSLLGGALRNELVLFVNLVTAAAMAVVVFMRPHNSPYTTLRDIGIASLARPIILLSALRPRALKFHSNRLPTISQWTYSYLLVMATVVTFQRLEIGFLKSRGSSADVAAFGISYDMAQVARSAVTSSFAILLPVFVAGLAANKTRTVENARTLAILTAYAVSGGGLALSAILRLTSLDVTLLGTTEIATVSAVTAGAALFAAGSVTATLLTSTLRYDMYLASVVITLIVAVLANFIISRTAFSASLATVITGAAFITSQSWFASQIASFQWFARLAMPATAIAAAAVLPNLNSSPIVSASFGFIVFAVVSLCLKREIRSLWRYLVSLKQKDSGRETAS